MLIEIHMLQNHAPCNLNRDDTGSPKDCMFGGVRRSRISSQSIKRSIRKSPVFTEEMKSAPMAIRTRRLPELVKERLVKEGVDSRMAEVAAQKVKEFGKSKEKKKEQETEEKEDKKEKKKKTEEKEDYKETETAQIMFITEKDVEYVVKVMKEVMATANTPEQLEKVEAKKIQKTLKGWRPITPDIALFGRMITSDAFEDVEASMQVAHALSTNKMDHEFDYFTAVDDLKKGVEDDPGAGMIGDVEFNSACYYKYFSLDFDNLVNNLAGPNPDEKTLKEAREIALTTTKAFINAAINTTPSGKQNTFAAHQLPDAILIEVRKKKIPVSYANAFVKPAAPNGKKDLVEESIDKLASYVEIINSKYDLESSPRLWFTTGNTTIKSAEICNTVNELINKTSLAV